MERAWISVSVTNFMAAIALCVSGNKSSDVNGTPMKLSGGSSASSAAAASAAASFSLTAASAASICAALAASAAARLLTLGASTATILSFFCFFFFLDCCCSSSSTSTASVPSSVSASPLPPALLPGRECLRLRLRALGPSGAAPSLSLTSGTYTIRVTACFGGATSTQSRHPRRRVPVNSPPPPTEIFVDDIRRTRPVHAANGQNSFLITL